MYGEAASWRLLFNHPEQLCNNTSCLVTREFLLWLLFCSRCLVLLQCCSSWLLTSHLIWVESSSFPSNVPWFYRSTAGLILLVPVWLSLQLTVCVHTHQKLKREALFRRPPLLPCAPGEMLPSSELGAVLSWCAHGSVQAVTWCYLPLQRYVFVLPFLPLSCFSSFLTVLVFFWTGLQLI